jgi:hypothetical protein
VLTRLESNLTEVIVGPGVSKIKDSINLGITDHLFQSDVLAYAQTLSQTLSALCLLIEAAYQG